METVACNAVLRGVEKRYPGFTLGPVDLTVPAGSIVGLVGENGAGKTTLLKLLTGINPADAGEITLLGGAPGDLASRADLGVVFEDAYFYESMTAKQIGKSLAGILAAGGTAKPTAACWRGLGWTPPKRSRLTAAACA